MPVVPKPRPLLLAGHTNPGFGMPVGLGRQQWGSWGRPWTGAGWCGLVSRPGLCATPHSVWEPEGRVGVYPQSPARWEGPGKLGAGGAGKASGLPVPGVPLPACSPQLLQLLGANAHRAQGTPSSWGCLRQGHEPTSGPLSPGGWATSRGWSWGLVGPLDPQLGRPDLSVHPLQPPAPP